MLIKTLERIQIAVGLICLSIFFVVIVIQVVTRLMGISATWTSETATYSFIWSVFMGASIMLNRREHFKFDMLLNRLKGKKQSTLYLINDTILLLFCLALFYFGIEAVENFWNYNWVSLPQLKKGYVWLSVPIMGGTMTVYTISHLVRTIKYFGREEVDK